MKFRTVISSLIGAIVFSSCAGPGDKSAQEILGNPAYKAIAYGGYRNQDRSQAPSVEDIKEDLQILDAMGIRILRTYHARLYDHTPNLLRAIHEMKQENPSFEMYVMLGVWMQCEGAWGDQPNHLKGDEVENSAEIEQAIKLANQYPDIVKVISVGNESMVHWAGSYYVHPRIILKEVLYLQSLKAEGKLPVDLWITSSDNFASWGGGDASYHLPALDSLIAAVDYLSVHSYPFHDTHYNPDWWWMPEEEDSLPKFKKIKAAVFRGIDRVAQQVDAVQSYQKTLGIDKPIHIGETGWASADNHLYGAEGSGAADEYKQMLFHHWIRGYCQEEGMACFYFEAFDEPWKDGKNPGGSENHFGLISVDGVVKAPLWADFDKGVFEGLSRGGHPLRKSLGAEKDRLLELSQLPPKQSDQPALRVTGSSDPSLILWSNEKDKASFVVQQYLSLNPWEGSCQMTITESGVLEIRAGMGDWWGGSLSAKEAIDLSAYAEGFLEITISGSPEASVEIGFQSGLYEDGSQENCAVNIGAETDYPFIEQEAKEYRMPLKSLLSYCKAEDIRSPFYIRGLQDSKGAMVRIHRMILLKS